MGIFHAIGLGIFLVVVSSLLPSVFAELTNTIVIFLKSAQLAFVAAGSLASHASDFPLH